MPAAPVNEPSGVAPVVLVTDGEQRSALAAVRSLGRSGYRVHVCSSRTRSIAGSSRYCQRAWTAADPLRQPNAYLHDLLRISKETGADVLLPVTEASLLAVLPHRSLFRSAIPFPSDESFRRICDKRDVLASARQHGIAVPEQTEVLRPDDVSGLRVDLHYPVVLKPSRSVAGDSESRVKSSVAYAETARQLHEELAAIPAAAYPVLLQHRVEGPGFAVSVIVWEGEVRAAFAHRRIREKPPSGGVSVLRESIALDARLLEQSVALLHDFNWNGVAMVEFKLDTKSGRPFLMEINGRLWGSLQLAIDAGVDFPTLLVQLALGERPPVQASYDIGVQSRWEWGDVDNLLAHLLRSDRALALPSNGKGRNRLGSVASFLRAIGSRAYPEVGRRDDPGPFVRETIDWLRGR